MNNLKNGGETTREEWYHGAKRLWYGGEKTRLENRGETTRGGRLGSTDVYIRVGRKRPGCDTSCYLHIVLNGEDVL